MALSLVGTPTTFASSTAVTTFSINVPTGVADGDLLLWHIVGQVATIPATPPTGWTPEASGTTTAHYSIVYRRIASSEPASYNSPTLTSARHASTMTCIRGADNTTPIDATTPAVTVGTTAFTFNAVTPVTAAAWVLGFGSGSLASGTAAGTASSTNLTMDIEATSTAAAAINVKSAVGHFAWTTGAFTPNMSNSTATTRTTGMTIAIRPAAAAAAIPPILVMAPRAA